MAASERLLSTSVDGDDDWQFTWYQRHGHTSLLGGGGQWGLLYRRVTVGWVPETWTVVLTRQWGPDDRVDYIPENKSLTII